MFVSTWRLDKLLAKQRPSPSNFPKVIKTLLKDLPKNDYPVLNTFLFASCWLGWVMDRSLVSMRDLLFRLNSRGIEIDISTFSKGSKTRDVQIFEEILNKAICQLRRKKGKSKSKILFPLDSTVIGLTSKLLWCQGYHQVKLFCGCNNWTNEVGGVVINFGQGHDSKYGEKTIKEIPENGIGIMDRGFASIERIRELQQIKDRYFVLRVKNNLTLTMQQTCNFLVGAKKNQLEARLVSFCDLENKSEYRLITNLSEAEISNEEVGEIYRHRWGIETLWKFLKMHLKLDKLMTKNVNGITIQIYSCLIAYIIL